MKLLPEFTEVRVIRLNAADTSYIIDASVRPPRTGDKGIIVYVTLKEGAEPIYIVEGENDALGRPLWIAEFQADEIETRERDAFVDAPRHPTGPPPRKHRNK